MHHPELTQDKHFEYQKLLLPSHKGVPYFQKTFSFDQFCYTRKNPDAKKYIDFLIENAGADIPVLQFNRSSFRIKWFKENYPRALNIYLVRNPRDQWQSSMSFFIEKNIDTFVTMDLLTASVNSDTDLFKNLSRHIPLFKFHDDDFEIEEFVYGRLTQSYSDEEKYFIFYYTWFLAFYLNTLYSDILIDMNLLTSSIPYRKKIYKLFNRHQISEVGFEDADIRTYNEYAISTDKMKEIEKYNQNIIIRSFIPEKNRLFSSKLESEYRDLMTHYKFNTITNNKNILRAKDNKEKDDKLQEGFRLLAKYSISLKKELKETKKQNIELAEKISSKNKQVVQKDQQLAQKDQQLAQKDRQLFKKDLELDINRQKVDELNRQIQDIYNSYSYRIGHRLIFPFSKIKKILKRSRH